MQKIPIIFFGTHNFAATILKGLIASPLFSIELVVTQPDKPAGRKKEIQKSPVKILAEKNNLKINQPKTLKNYKPQATSYKLAIVAQYGMIIPKNIIDAPKYGTINVHTSLLPKYRGASPIQTAIINGETETGVTIMKMDEGLDTGPILIQKSVKIGKDDTYPQLDSKLAQIGLQGLLEATLRYIEGKIKPKAQNDNLASDCKQLSRESGKINWKLSAQKLYNLYRGLMPWPGIWTTWNGQRLKLIEIKPSDKKIKEGTVEVDNDKIFIGCSKNSIEVFKLQLEGKKAMNAKDFINGYQAIDGVILK